MQGLKGLVQIFDLRSALKSEEMVRGIISLDGPSRSWKIVVNRKDHDFELGIYFINNSGADYVALMVGLTCRVYAIWCLVTSLESRLGGLTFILSHKKPQGDVHV